MKPPPKVLRPLQRSPSEETLCRVRKLLRGETNSGQGGWVKEIVVKRYWVFEVSWFSRKWDRFRRLRPSILVPAVRPFNLGQSSTIACFFLDDCSFIILLAPLTLFPIVAIVVCVLAHDLTWAQKLLRRSCYFSDYSIPSCATDFACRG